VCNDGSGDHGNDGHGHDVGKWMFRGPVRPPCPPPMCQTGHDDHGYGGRDHEPGSPAFDTSSHPTCPPICDSSHGDHGPSGQYGHGYEFPHWPQSSNRVVTIHAGTISALMPGRSRPAALPAVLALLTAVAAGAGFVVRRRVRM